MKNSKKQLKKSILGLRDKLDKNTVKELSDIIFEKVFALDCYKKAKHILIYNSFNNEVSTHNAVKKIIAEKNAYMPRINAADNIEAVKIGNNSEYFLNKYGIKEPYGQAADDGIIELAIVPGVVFDGMGGRLGYGKAYFDIFLRGKSIYKIAVCYDFQLIDAIPVDLLDVSMDCIVTDKRIVKINGFRG